MRNVEDINNLLNEPKILRLLNESIFIPEIISSFQDYDNIYIVTTFYNGPILFKFAYEELSEKQIKFLTACMIQALKYLREKEIIHRDLSFQNIIMDRNNYFNLIDFSFSVSYSNRNLKKFYCIIDPIFTAPEILNKTECNYNSDYYRLGNLIFFLVFKKFPLDIKKSNNNLTELAKDYNLTYKFSNNILDFTSKLIESNWKTRLGYKSINELINHPWFKEFDWEKLEKKQIVSPFNINNSIVIRHTCKNFIKTKNRVENYVKFAETKYYKQLLKNFEYSKYDIK